ncbi:hypothetical protein CFP56_002664 [Quercus suber]|uniref:Transmembrane protein n=1 Tax=Quercus suber TaxID=58331 RepID=A0AAW0LF68_QUESU
MGAKTSIRIIIIPMLIIFLFLSSTYTMVVAEPNNVIRRSNKNSILRATIVQMKINGRSVAKPSAPDGQNRIPI